MNNSTPIAALRHLLPGLLGTEKKIVFGSERKKSKPGGKKNFTYDPHYIVVITSDNGGSPWFGGLNAPLRGGKSNPFEGGVRVPAVFLDFSSDPNQKLGSFHGLTHVSDWFPTLASLAGVPARSLPADIDGVSIAHHLSPARRISDGLEASGDECKSEARDGVLLEMWEEYDTPFGESLEAYRWKDFKFINGSVRDPNHYCESLTGYFLNISNPMWISYSVELLSKGLEAIYGVGRSDSLRIILTHQVVQSHMLAEQRKRGDATLLLFNLTADPLELVNLALPLLKTGSKSDLKDLSELTEEQRALRKILDTISARLNTIRNNKPITQNTSLQMEKSKWRQSTVPGDCSSNPLISSQECKFTHPWIADDVDPWTAGDLVPAVFDIEEKAVKSLKILFVGAICLLLLLRKLFSMKK